MSFRDPLIRAVVGGLLVALGYVVLVAAGVLRAEFGALLAVVTVPYAIGYALGRPGVSVLLFWGPATVALGVAIVAYVTSTPGDRDQDLAPLANLPVLVGAIGGVAFAGAPRGRRLARRQQSQRQPPADG